MSEDEKRPRRDLRRRLEEGRQTFQPGLWSRLVGLGVAAVFLILFVILNTRRTKISFVFVSTRVSVIWVILLSLAIGIVVGVLLSQVHRHRAKR